MADTLPETEGEALTEKEPLEQADNDDDPLLDGSLPDGREEGDSSIVGVSAVRDGATLTVTVVEAHVDTEEESESLAESVVDGESDGEAVTLGDTDGEPDGDGDAVMPDRVEVTDCDEDPVTPDLEGDTECEGEPVMPDLEGDPDADGECVTSEAVGDRDCRGETVSADAEGDADTDRHSDALLVSDVHMVYVTVSVASALSVGAPGLDVKRGESVRTTLDDARGVAHEVEDADAARVGEPVADKREDLEGETLPEADAVPATREGVPHSEGLDDEDLRALPENVSVTDAHALEKGDAVKESDEDALALWTSESEGESEPLRDALAEPDGKGVRDAERLRDALLLREWASVPADGVAREALGDTVGLREPLVVAEDEGDAEGLRDASAEPEARRDAVGLRESLVLAEGEGDADAEGDALPLSDEDGVDETVALAEAALDKDGDADDEPVEDEDADSVAIRWEQRRTETNWPHVPA